MDFQLLSFSQKYDTDMRELELVESDLVIGDKVRLFLYKPKFPSNTSNKINKQTTFDMFNIDITCFLNIKNNIKNLSNKNFSYEINKPFKINYDNNRNVSFVVFGADYDNCYIDGTLQLEWKSNPKKSNYFVSIMDDYCKIRIDIIFENNVDEYELTGTIKIIGETNESTIYSNAINPTDNFGTKRVSYEIISIDTNNKEFVGKLLKDFYSDDIPSNITFNFDHIFQYIGDSSQIEMFDDEEYVYTYKETKNVTDWNGKCIDPNARKLVEIGDMVRCRISKCKYKDFRKRNFDHNGTKYEDEDAERWYFKILNFLNEDEFFGELCGIYDMDVPNNYAVILLSKNCISEIPISWQDDNRQQIFKDLLHANI